MEMNKVQVQQLKTGDVLSGTKATVLQVVNRAYNLPSQKVQVTVEYKNGKVRTAAWGRYTEIGIDGTGDGDGE